MQECGTVSENPRVTSSSLVPGIHYTPNNPGFDYTAFLHLIFFSSQDLVKRIVVRIACYYQISVKM